MTAIDTGVCPLCDCQAALTTKRVVTRPLREYWKFVGYDLDAHHPGFPEEFSVSTCVRCGLGNFLPRMIGGPKLYEALGRHEFYYEEARWDHRFAAHFLQERDVRSFLEFGCGEGKFLDCVSRIVPTTQGIDFNATACERAKARGHDVHTTWSQGVKPSFEAIATFQTLEHVPNPGEVIKDLVNRLAPGGYLIIAVPNEDGPLGELRVNPLNAPPHHATLWPSLALKHVGKMHNLTLVCYATEQMNRDLYFSLVNDSLGKAFDESKFLHRVALKVLRPAFRAYASMQSLVPGMLPYAGHNHLAVFQREGRPAQAA